MLVFLNVILLFQDLEGGERYHQQEQVQAGINTGIDIVIRNTI